MVMGQLENLLENAVRDGKVPHAVVYATSRDGSFTYHHASGYNIVGKDEKVSEDACFMLASQTKLMTTISALQVVEKGLIGLDDDVAGVLPEVAEQKILTGWDERDEPILVERKGVITLRHLLTHTSGLCYDAAHPDLIKFQHKRGHALNTGDTIPERFGGHPLVFEPGTNWIYSSGIDWAGKLVERLTDRSLEQHMQTNLWVPLGITGITFWPFESEELRDTVPALTVRTPEGELVLNDAPTINTGSKDCFGGHGAYARMSDYLKILHCLLANDGRILRPATVEEMFTPQLSPGAKAGLQSFRQGPYAAMLIGENDPSIDADWGLGGMLFMEDDEGRRKKGTLSWGGMVNTFWLVDREAGVTLTFGTQVLPPGDKGVTEVITGVERGVYGMAGVEF
ncbi:uncharacterized protein LTR77_004940 [Saxophila tyrrhenica]|uniref:Beta-lactamase-related domain-containing protein n=1 Tax=Saxophila tyrrhenica TaxID=1690608 RepID=A0AAV9PBC6_9PEZI|nr:hypothetical protein LTR77_004940 [Saxophila tyrrhenica]